MRAAFFAAMPTSLPTLGGSSPNRPDSISSREPRMEVNGVRSSWLTMETKSRRARSASRSHWLNRGTAYSSSTQLASSRSDCRCRLLNRRGTRSITHNAPTRYPDGAATG